MDFAGQKIAVVTGAASGIGLGLAEALATNGCHVVLADVDAGNLAKAAEIVESHGVDTLQVTCDVSNEESVLALAAAAYERFGAVHVLCNNAGVQSAAEPWTGPLSAWKWVVGVNFWGVVHGVRAFLPRMLEQGSGHIVNTASIAGLIPGFAPSYDASKHAVVAITEDLWREAQTSGWPIGVSVLCPGWVRTGIMDADRNWPAEMGDVPGHREGTQIVERYVRLAVDEGTTPAAVAELVVESVKTNRFWIFPHPEFVELCVKRWEDIGEGIDPVLFRDMPGLPPIDQLMTEILESLVVPEADGDAAPAS